MLGLVYLFVLSYQETLYQTQSMTATDLAVEQIETLKIKDFEQLVSGNEESVMGYPEFRRSWNVRVHPDNLYLKEITVMVEWKNKLNRPLKITLSTDKSKL